MQAAQIKQQLWPLLQRTFNRELSTENFSPQTLAEWDSLNHINLMFELESQFNVNLSPDDIALLYSDTDTMVQFLCDKLSA